MFSDILNKFGNSGAILFQVLFLMILLNNTKHFVGCSFRLNSSWLFCFSCNIQKMICSLSIYCHSVVTSIRGGPGILLLDLGG